MLDIWSRLVGREKCDDHHGGFRFGEFVVSQRNNHKTEISKIGDKHKPRCFLFHR